jgi:hypothetical protein
MTLLEFIKKNKSPTQSTKLLNIHNILTLILLFFLEKELLLLIHNKVNSPFLVIVSFIILTTGFLLLWMEISLSRKSFNNQRKLKIRDESLDFIKDIVRYTRQTNKYDKLNTLLLLEESKDYYFEICYFLCEHFSGDWVQSEFLTFPADFPEPLDFWEKSKLFFKKEVSLTRESLLDDTIISAYLWTVRPNAMNTLLKELE